MSIAGSERSAGLLLFAVPPVAVAGGALVLVFLGVLGLNPFWAPPDMTMAEAVALRDQASVVVMARAGVSPAARMRVRPGMLGNRQELRLTPAEAALRADRGEMLEVLLLNGFRPDRSTIEHLICFGRQWESEEALPYLIEQFPEAASQPCTPAMP